MTDDWLAQVGEALHERAQRVYDRYGNVMLEVQGMTKAGIDRKATARQLFSKLLYLSGEQPSRPDLPSSLLHQAWLCPTRFACFDMRAAFLRYVQKAHV